MVSNKEMFRFRRSWPWWRWVLAALIVLGLTLSAYLSWHVLVRGSVIGCGGGNSCDQVLGSRWSSVAGVLPVSGLAAGTYLAMLMTVFFIGTATEMPVRRLAWRTMLIMVGAAAGSAVWFIIVQKWIVGAFCPYCMAAHITSLLLAALVIWQAPKQLDDSSTEVAPTKSAPVTAVPRRVVGHLPTAGFATVGLILASVMVVCQVTIAPPPKYRAGETKLNPPVIDTHNAPLIGSPDAPYVVNLLFDYKCPHCQELHFMLDEVVRRYNGKLAFVLCPTPLNTQCNPYIPQDLDEFKGSCELAKVALTVWAAKREAFPAFDLWMFSLESGDRWQPRSIEAAKAKAVELVGQAKFDAALADPWITRYMQTSIRIYGDTVQSASNPQRANAVPKMVFGARWVIPEPNDADDLLVILQNSLGLPEP